MEELFRIASNISNPLALSGLFAAIIFLILRQIIAKDIFPALTKAVGGELLKHIVDRLFVLALIAMVLGFIGFVVTSVRSKAPDSANATLVDDMTAKDAIETLAAAENFSVDFKDGCHGASMESKIRGGEIKGKSTVELIEQLGLRLKNPRSKIKYQVTKIEDRGVYEIACK